MTTLVGVHGIHQYRAGHPPLDVARYWAGEWQRALTRGPLGTSAQNVRFELGYYAHRLRPTAEQGETSGLDGLDQQTQQMIREWLEEHGQDAGINQGRLTASLRQEVATLAHRLNYSPKAVETFAAWFFPEVSRYLFGDPNVRHQVCADVANAIAAAEPPRIVIAHSLGSVVAYETLHYYHHFDIDLLITIGSPLAMSCVFDKLDPPPRNSRGIRPQAVRRWINIADKGDLIAIPRHGIRDKFDDLETDHETSIHWLDFHTANNYLATTIIADTLRPHLS